MVLPVLKRGEVAGLTPSLHGLREIDGEPGLEIVVNEAAGASTQFVGVYRVGEEAIEQLRFPKGTAGLFAFGGSVGHLEAVDCSGRANVVVSSAVPAPGEGALEENLYRVGRIFINYEGSRPEVESKEIQRVPIEDLDRFPEYANSPFGSCAAP